MNFEYGADPYFVREQAFERMADATVPSGVHARPCRRCSAPAD